MRDVRSQRLPASGVETEKKSPRILRNGWSYSVLNVISGLRGLMVCKCLLEQTVQLLEGKDGFDLVEITPNDPKVIRACFRGKTDFVD